jgi:putative transposase
MKRRLNRLGELYTDVPVYFVTACTDHRQPILANDPAHETFVTFCVRAKEHGVVVGKYVLMPDHLHLFVCIPPGATGLSDWMKSLKNSLSKHWRSEGIPAPHWQKGFFDHLLRHEESHAEKWKYTADNPVRAGLCGSPKDWRFTGEINQL